MITVEKGVSADDALRIAHWTNDRGADFLRQWSGSQWEFPLTVDQIMTVRDSLYSIRDDGEFIGIISEIRREGGNVHIGRFLLDRELTGRGLGSEALSAFCGMLFEDPRVETVSLIVYDYNSSARRCYEKCGFAVERTLRNEGEPDATRMVLGRDKLPC